MIATATSPEREALLALLRTLVLEIVKESRETLELLRITKGWTQQRLSMESGVCPRTISRIESGKGKANPATIVALARALGADYGRVAAACVRR